MVSPPNPSTPDIDTLKSNLYLLSTDFESLKGFFKGYSDPGIYSECLEAVRESMAAFPSIIKCGQFSLETIAKIFECYYLMESLARYPFTTNNAEAFKSDENWNHVRKLAKEAAGTMG